MRKDDMEMMDDELRPEYDLKRLKVRKVGPGRKHFRGRQFAWKQMWPKFSPTRNP